MYEAPQIIGQQELSASLSIESGLISDPSSDAEIKHGVKAVTAYEAPQITGQRELSASLFIASNIDGQ